MDEGSSTLVDKCRQIGERKHTLCSEQLHIEDRCLPELTYIQGMVQTLLARVGRFLSLTYLVLDGHFGNNNALQMTLQCRPQLISKLRFDAALYFPYEGEYAGRGPRRKYGDRLQPEAVPVRYLKQVTLDKRIETRVDQAQMRPREFAQPLNVVSLSRVTEITGVRFCRSFLCHARSFFLNRSPSSCDYLVRTIPKGGLGAMAHDEVQVKQVLAGNRDAFSPLVDKYQGMVCGLAYHRVGDFELARDLAQEAFLHAYRCLGKLKDPARFSQWLHSITVNVCLSWLRRRSLQTVSLADSDTSLAHIADPLPTPEMAVLATEEQNLVRCAIANLPEPQRLVVTLYYMNEMGIDEMSRFLGVSPGTIKSRLHHARKQLRGRLMMKVAKALTEQKPGREFTEELSDRLDRVLEESTAILTRLLQIPSPDRGSIQQMKRMVEQFCPVPSDEIEFKQRWDSIFESVWTQNREAAFEQVMQLIHQAAGLDNWGWQLYALASLDVLRMMEMDTARQPKDINVLMGYVAGQHTHGGRFEWRLADWHCVSWGDIGLHEQLYRMHAKIPTERLEVGTRWSVERPAWQDEGSVYETTVEAQDDTITVPAGTFENCLRIETKVYANRLAKRTQRQKHTLWLAPGTGIVKFAVRGWGNPEWSREMVLKEAVIPEHSESYFPLVIGSRWHYKWDDPGFYAPTAEVYRLLCQKGEDFYFSRARYIYGNYADSEVGKIAAGQEEREA